ncbi:hypothetical protein BH11PSE8_BH11PSE8_00760 [soil metagenome]
MAQSKTAEIRKRRVWRITEAAPAGEFVDADQIQVRAERTEVTPPGFVASSYELLAGVDVNDDPDSVPAELFDELFNKH